MLIENFMLEDTWQDFEAFQKGLIILQTLLFLPQKIYGLLLLALLQNIQQGQY